MKNFMYPRWLLIGLWYVAMLGHAHFVFSADEAALQSHLETLQARKDLPPEHKAQLLALYREALAWQEKARSYQREKHSYLHVRRAPDSVAQLVDEEDAEHDWAGEIHSMSLQRARVLLATLEAERASIEARIDELSQQLSFVAKEQKNQQQLARLHREMDTLQQRLARTEPLNGDALAQAEYRRDRAKLQAFQAQADMLEQKILARPAHLEQLRAQLAAAKATAKRLAKRIDALEEHVDRLRRQEAEQMRQTESATEKTIKQRFPVLAPLAEENADLSAQLKRLTQALGEASQRRKSLQEQFQALDEAFRESQRKVAIAGLKEALGQVLLEQKLRLPNARIYRDERAFIHERISEVGLLRLRHQEMQHMLETKKALRDWFPDLPASQEAALSPPWQALIQRRKALLERLLKLETAYLQELNEWLLRVEHGLERLASYDAFLAEHLLWVRNTPVLSWQDFSTISRELQVVFAGEPWLLTGKGLLALLGERLELILPLVLLLSAAGYMRFSTACGSNENHPSLKPTGAHFGRVVKTLFFCALRPLPSVLLLLYVSWLLKQATLSSEQAVSHAHALAFVLQQAAAWVYFLLVSRRLALPNGWLERYLGWQASSVRQLRRALGVMGIVILPLSMLEWFASQLGQERLATGVSMKLLLVCLAVGLIMLIHALFNPRLGAVATYLQKHQKGYLYHLRWFWFGLLLLIPLASIFLALLGYVYTAASFLRFHLYTLGWLACMVVLQQLAEHWLLSSRRRIAYKAALERRQRLLKTRHQKNEVKAAKLRTTSMDERVDLVALSHESRRLLNALIVVLGAVGLWGIWAPVMPALGYFDSIVLWQQNTGENTMVALTLGDLLGVFMMALATWIAAKNLPSLLEIVLLRYTRVSAGGRYTARTLSGYLIASLGIVAIFKALGGDWGQIQWLVAALGVGIGFGLQEIVANFISGLIILFERPIRVGDFVTVGDTDGTVTRIRIRATTILTRDNKELLVPNKEFITGRLLNWSLSDSSTRLKLEVGIAYGEDIELAEKLMLQAAHETPQVQSEPRPWVNFRRFGDSALILELRCHIRHVDERVQTLSQLHHAIERKFRAAGIAIPFPQMDVHLDVKTVEAN